MDELHQLRERHDALPDPSSRSIIEARARLSTHMSKPPARRAGSIRRVPVHSLWGTGLAGATAAAVFVVGIVGIVGMVSDPGARPTTSPPSVSVSPQELRLRTVANARDLADNAAAVAAAEGDSTPAPDQWVYIKKLIVQTRTDGGQWLSGRPKKTATHEMWRRADDQQLALIENGELKITEGSEFEVTYAFLLSLPAEPDALLAHVNAQIEAEEVKQRERRYKELKQRFGEEGKAKEALGPLMSTEERHMWAFRNIAQGMRDAALPSKLRAAMYGAMARIPGVRYEARAFDLARRNGVTLYRIHNGYLRDEIFIDPKTYAYLGYRTIAVRDHDHDQDFFAVKKGQITGWDALLKTSLVEEPGSRS